MSEDDIVFGKSQIDNPEKWEKGMSEAREKYEAMLQSYVEIYKDSDLKKCINYINELELKLMNHEACQTANEILIEIAERYTDILLSREWFDFNNELDIKEGERIKLLLAKMKEA